MANRSRQPCAIALNDQRTAENAFRALLVLQIILFFLMIFLAIIDEVLTSQAVTDLVGEEEVSTTWLIVSIGLFGLIFVIALPAYLISIVGLFFWKGWARWLYTISWIFFTAVFIPYSAFDFQWDYQWGLPGSIDGLSEAVNGATLAFLFMSPVSERFTRREQTISTST